MVELYARLIPPLEERSNWHIERGSDFCDILKRDIPLPSFNIAEIGNVHLGLGGESSLRPSPRFSKPHDTPSQPLLDFLIWWHAPTLCVDVLSCLRR